MRYPLIAALLSVSGVAGACGDSAVLVRVDGDLAVPAQLDGICLAIFDRDSAGGAFARFYRLEAELGGLPQTLAVEPGQATAATAIVRGYAGGVEIDRAVVSFDFGGTGEVVLRLGTCADAPRAAENVATRAIPANARVAVSFGRGGSRIVAVGAGESLTLRATANSLEVVSAALPSTLAAVPAQLVAFDADGDCDDDIMLVFDGAAPQMWRRDGSVSVEAPEAFTGVAAIRTAAPIDADGDGDIDLVVADQSSLFLLRNDGAGRFLVDAAALPANATDDVTALATGDVDGDGHPDIIAGRGSTSAAAMRVLVNDQSGTGFFELTPAVLPALPLRVRGLALVDVDGDRWRDLVVASDNDNVRLYVNRGGLLEDKSFVSLPDVNPVIATSLAVADWDDACVPDIAVATGIGTILWPGEDGGTFRQDMTPVPAADQVVAADVDDDGAVDLLVVSASEVTWVRR